MLLDLNREVVTWLGYLQRGSVLLQLTIVVSAVLFEKRSRWTRRLNSEVFSSFAELAAPLLLILLGAAIKALGVSRWLGAVPGHTLAALAAVQTHQLAD